MSDPNTKPTWLQRWRQPDPLEELTDDELAQAREFKARFEEEINKAVNDRRDAELKDTE